LHDNPFAVQTPEDISAKDVVSLFVDVFTDFYNVPNVGHTFIHGPRGSGKSMMFRFLEPDCQQIHSGKTLNELKFYSVYVPIKNTDLKLTELARLENKHANYILNEHLLALYVGSRVFLSLQSKANLVDDSSRAYSSALITFFEHVFKRLIVASGWPEYSRSLAADASLSECIKIFTDTFDQLYGEVSNYLKHLSFRKRPLPYSGAICGYLDFLLPLLRGLRQLPFMPKGPIFLLIDDADNLNEAQTQILNSWVFCRTSTEVSLKISTQLNYKTYRTVSDKRIDAPHDYSEINISSVYASAQSRYADRVSEIVKKRLLQVGIRQSPEEFFPPYKKQEDAISRIAEDYKAQWEKTGRGYRPRDDANRYARPDYMRSLAGRKKSSSKYRYAGFEQLVYLSSGVIRFFLDAASKMYAEALSNARSNSGDKRGIQFIEPPIQDEIMRKEADNFMFAEFDKISADESNQSAGALSNLQRLQNLIRALGGAFHHVLMSNASERRVFSIAFSDTPDSDVLGALDLGVQYGYFHESSIGNKEGTGRTKLFVLSRRLAPFFSLDPTGFAGYKFVTSAALREAIARPKAFVERISKNVNQVFEDPPQLSLFERQER
jgi:hypothetical protein